MSLLEYGRMILKGVQKPDEVLMGWINAAKAVNNKLDENELKVIIDRRAICETCPFMSKNAINSKEYLELTGNHYTTNRKSEHCTLCLCPINSKTASLGSNCGIEDWNMENPEKQMDLKWKKFKK